MGERPFFVVGCPRSGTTLVQLMLDSHPRLAVSPESHFVVEGPGAHEDVAAALERILVHRRFQVWELDPGAVREAVARQRVDTYSDLIRCLFQLFAETRGKQRWGDKTPGYVYSIPRLIELFPDARFIHVIRDGREVAASQAEQAWGLSSAVIAAIWWRRAVVAGCRSRRLGPGRYHELRLDQLIASPEETLRRVCSFLDEPFAPEMLEYHRDADSRVAMYRGTDHRHLSRPPTPGLRDWTAGLSRRDQLAVEAVCHFQLKRLGMRTTSPPITAYIYAASQVLRSHLPARAQGFKVRLKTAIRSVVGQSGSQ